MLHPAVIITVRKKLISKKELINYLKNEIIYIEKEYENLAPIYRARKILIPPKKKGKTLQSHTVF